MCLARSLDYGSIRATLVHLLRSEAGYLARWKGEQRDHSINEDNLPTLAALSERWSVEQTKMQAFLAQLTDMDLQREVRQVSPQSGREYVNPLWALMAQCINHGTQHRSEVALTITQLGHSPGDLDLIVYLRDSEIPPNLQGAHGREP